MQEMAQLLMYSGMCTWQDLISFACQTSCVLRTAFCSSVPAWAGQAVAARSSTVLDKRRELVLGRPPVGCGGPYSTGARETWIYLPLKLVELWSSSAALGDDALGEVGPARLSGAQRRDARLVSAMRRSRCLRLAVAARPMHCRGGGCARGVVAREHLDGLCLVCFVALAPTAGSMLRGLAASSIASAAAGRGPLHRTTALRACKAAALRTLHVDAESFAKMLATLRQRLAAAAAGWAASSPGAASSEENTLSAVTQAFAPVIVDGLAQLRDRGVYLSRQQRVDLINAVHALYAPLVAARFRSGNRLCSLIRCVQVHTRRFQSVDLTADARGDAPGGVP